MKDRLFHLRKEVLHLSREKFGAPIGMTDSELKNIEYGKTQLKEIKIPLICSTYNVNETWLRTGEGEIFHPMPRGEEIGQVDPEEAVRFFHFLLDGMSDAEIVLMYQIFKKQFFNGGK